MIIGILQFHINTPLTTVPYALLNSTSIQTTEACMGTITRSVRAVIRSPLRAGLLVGVLAVSIGLVLIMITVNGAFGQRLDEIRSQVGTSITVRPAGSFGGGFFRGGGDGGNAQPSQGGAATPAPAEQATLTDENIAAISSLAHVVSVAKVITTRYTGTELVAAAVQPPNGGAFPAGRSFTPPILVTGTDDPSNLASNGFNQAKIASGRTFDQSESSANVALIGQGLADANKLSVGSKFTIDGTSLEVVGIYTTNTQFGDNSLFLPLETARTIFSRPAEIDEAVVQADTAANVSTVADEIRNTLGTNTADVITQEAAFAAISSPISDAEGSSQIAMIAALVASAVIILFSVGLVARQRIKEIGILKAIGASNWHVISQFTLETALISVFAAFLGALATFPLAQSVANGLVSTPSAGGFGGGGGGRVGPGFRAIAAGAQSTGILGNVNVAVSPEVFLYALAIAVGLALVATIVPAWYVGRVRPAEVLRNE